MSSSISQFFDDQADIIDLLPDALVLVDSLGIIRKANVEAQRLFGYSLAELVGAKVELLIPGRLQTIHRQHRTEYFKEPRLRRMGAGLELFGRHKDGAEFPVDIMLGPISSGQETLVMALVRDISYLVKQEKAVEESEFLAHLVIQNAYDAFVAIDLQGRVTDWNPRAQEMFGWSKEEIIGRRLSETIIPPQYREAHENGLVRFKQTGEGPVLNKRIQITAITKEGQEFPVELAVFPLQLGGKTNGFCAFLQDISERKAQEEKVNRLTQELTRSNQELQEFAYIAAHDLREPLRTIAGFTRLLAQQLVPHLDSDTKENVEFVLGATSRMQQLIDGLLAYARVQSRGKNFEKVDCNKVVERVVESLKASIDEAQAKIKLALLPEVKGDVLQLEQVFTNLIANAIKFRGEKPLCIDITGISEKGYVLFSVADNGIGIDSQYQERIFKLYQRLHTLDKYSGAGIGLALCKRIVERHGGRIWVESQLNCGATFYFTIPPGDS